MNEKPEVKYQEQIYIGCVCIGKFTTYEEGCKQEQTYEMITCLESLELITTPLFVIMEPECSPVRKAEWYMVV